MKFLALAVEQSNKACDWRRLRELLPPLVKRLQAGDAAALRATDPYESLLYINSAATSLRVAKQHVDDTRHGDHFDDGCLLLLVPILQAFFYNIARKFVLGHGKEVGIDVIDNK